jgi:hypothetical protein
MTPPFQFDDDTPILIEVTPARTDDTDTREGLTIGGGVKQAYHESVRQAFNTIYQMARRTGYMIQTLREDDTQASLSGVEVEFGLTFNSNVEAFITKSGAEATVNVKLTWQVKGDDDDR